MTRRKGDTRAFDHVKGVPLRLTPTHNEPIRWHPRHGDPSCIIEWLAQTTWEHRILVYIAVVTTLTFWTAVFGVPAWIPYVEATLAAKVVRW